MNYRREGTPDTPARLSGWDRTRSRMYVLVALVLLVYALGFAHADRAATWAMACYSLVLLVWADLVERTARQP